MGPRIHSVPGTVQQLVHLAVGQRRQREGPVQMFHVQGSPEQRDMFSFSPLGLVPLWIPFAEFLLLLSVICYCVLNTCTNYSVRT